MNLSRVIKRGIGKTGFEVFAIFPIRHLIMLDEACVHSETLSEVLLKAKFPSHVTGPVELLRITP